MDRHAQHIATFTSCITYLGGGTLIINDILHLLDSHAQALGVLFVAANFMTNLGFKIYDRWKTRVVRT